MKSVLFAALVLVSSQSFAANVACEQSQSLLNKAHANFTKVVASLNYSYEVCPQAPDAHVCSAIFLNAYDQALVDLRHAGDLRNSACAE